MFSATQLAEMIFLHRELGHGVCLCEQLLENAEIAAALEQRMVAEAQGLDSLVAFTSKGNA